MKKNKPEVHSIPITNNNKKNLKPETLFTPYKIQWDSCSAHEKNVQANNKSEQNKKSKGLFSNMKTQLLTMKNDVQKLLYKQNNKNTNFQNDLNLLTNCASSGTDIKLRPNPIHNHPRKLKRAVFGLPNHNKLNHGDNCNVNEFTVENQQSNFDIEQDHSKVCRNEQAISYQKFKQQASSTNIHSHEQPIQQKQSHQSQFIKVQNIVTNNQKQIKDKNQKIDKLEQQARIQKSLIVQLQKQNNLLVEAVDRIKTEQTQLKQKYSQTQQKKNLQENYKLLLEQFQNQVSKNKNLQLKVQQLLTKCSDTDILRYNHKQIADSQKNIQYYEQKSVDDSKALLISQNTSLKLYIQAIRSQHALNKQSYTKNWPESNMESLGIQFEQKINRYADENFSLKNKVNELTASVEALTVSQKFMLQTIQAYQNRQLQKSGKNSNSQQTQRNIITLQQQINQLIAEKEQMMQEHDLKIMQLENIIDSTKENIQSKSQLENKSSINQSFNKILKDQLQENDSQRLLIKELKFQLAIAKDKLRQEEVKVSNMTNTLQKKDSMSLIAVEQCKRREEAQKFQISRMQNQIKLLQKKQETLHKLIQSKNLQIKEKDQFIKKSLGIQLPTSKLQNNLEWMQNNGE